MNIKEVFKKNKLRLLFTLLLLLIESFVAILFPLFIGNAVDGAIKNSYLSIYQLGGLIGLLIIIGGFRRLYDSRFYGKLFIQLGSQLKTNEDKNEISTKNARLNMLTEITEFMENQIPELIQHTFGLVGVAIIILSLNVTLFLYSLAAGVGVLLIYWFSSRKTTHFNQQLNNEMEAQVDIVSKSNQDGLKQHISRLTRINIKLSDLETVNFSLSWLIMSVFLLLSIVVAVSGGVTEYGALFALIMYVYQYIENVVSLPIFYQQWLRLKEIYYRLTGV